jgi:hypothetical protein
MQDQNTSSGSEESIEEKPLHRHDAGRDVSDASKKDQQTEDNVESSSSTGSDGGKGVGSGGGGGGGYIADCSSSDASSLDAAKANVPEKEMTRLSIAGASPKERAQAKDTKPSKTSKTVSPKAQKADRQSADQTETSNSTAANHEESTPDSGANWKNEDGMKETYSLPQWNGVRIHHPMDPRIDLSTVGHIQTSVLSAFHSNVDIPTQHDEQPARGTDNPSESAGLPLPPSIEQYMNLMEVK